jgi:hypothetical protein
MQPTAWELHPELEDGVTATVVTGDSVATGVHVDFQRERGSTPNFVFYVHPTVESPDPFMGYGPNAMRRRRVITALLPLLHGTREWSCYAPRYNGVSLSNLGNLPAQLVGLVLGARDVAAAFEAFRRDVLATRRRGGRVVVSGFSQGAVVLSVCIQLGLIQVPASWDLVLLGCFVPSFFPLGIDVYPREATVLSLAWGSEEDSSLVAASTTGSFRLEATVLHDDDASDFPRLMRQHLGGTTDPFVLLRDMSSIPYMIQRKDDGRLYLVPDNDSSSRLSAEAIFAMAQYGRSIPGWGAHGLDATLCPAESMRLSL